MLTFAASRPQRFSGLAAFVERFNAKFAVDR